MSGLFLNKVQDDGDTGLKPPTAGKWTSDPNFLATYARVVEVKDQLGMDDLARSVPSVFQRPLQFYKALEQKENPLHAAVQSEWRGLLAALALEQLLNAPIKVDLFTVPTVNSGERSRVGNAEIGDLHFRAALRYQLPRRKLEEATVPGAPTEVSDFESWSMIRCQGELLGATSPWSVVYTAASYKAPPAIPWQDAKGRLIDPIAFYDPLRKRERLDHIPVALSMLYAWVSDLLGNSGNFGYESALTAYKAVLVHQLEAWKSALAPYKADGMQLDAHASRFAHPPFSRVLTFVGGLKGEDESDLFVKTTRGVRLLLSESLASQTRVYKGVFVAQVDIGSLPAEGARFKTRDDQEIVHPFLHADPFFFPRRLVRLKLAAGALQAKPATRQDSVSTLTLPIRPEFFKYFTHEQLQSWLRVDDRGQEGGAVAILTLPVGGGHSVELRHVYGPGNIVNVETPGLALWPEAYDPEWNANMAGYAAPENDLSVVPVFADSGAPDKAMEAAVPGPSLVRVWHCKDRPALGFALSVLPRRGGTPQVAEPAGLVLRNSMSPPEAQIQPKRTWRVGVDFGTSSTTVMFDDLSGEETKLLPFKGRLLALTDDSIGGTTELTRSLYPEKSFDPPFHTLLYEAAATQFGDVADRSAYSIRFALDFDADKRYQLVRNLKWDAGEGGGRGSDALKVYLKALVRYILWEARSKGVERVSFLWSYPTSLPEKALITMEKFWTTLSLERFHAAMSVAASEPPISESNAACLAMKAAGVVNLSTSALTIGVDIGGGSTDISFWSEDKLRNQVSFKIAGNDLLDKGLLTDDALKQVLSVCQPDALQSGKVDEAIRTIRERPEVYIAGALSRAGESRGPGEHPFTRYIAAEGDKAPWKYLRSLVYLYATGLSYYLGTQSRVFSVPSSDVVVYFGGRGSMFLKWLTINNAQLNSIMKHAFVAGLGRVVPDDGIENRFVLTPALDLRFAGQAFEADPRLPALKTEVAAGLLVASAHASSASAPNRMERSVTAGEIRWQLRTVPGETKTVGWDAKLTEETLGLIEAPDHFDSTLIGQFLSEMLKDDPNRYVENQSLDLRLLALRLKSNDIVQLVRDAARADEKVLQPIFAYELKALMNQYVNMVTHAAQ